MGLVERTKRNMLQAKTERQGRDKEKADRRKAETALGEARKETERLQEELRKSNEKLKQYGSDLSKAKEDLEVEQGMSESLRIEVERMNVMLAKKDQELQKEEAELKKVTEILEKTEREANITYRDCVEKYKESQEFKDEIAAGAGSFHAVGFQDCLDFIGAGNVVDLEKHSVEKFQDLHLEGYEPEPEGVDAEGPLPVSTVGEENLLKSAEGRDAGGTVRDSGVGADQGDISTRKPEEDKGSAVRQGVEEQPADLQEGDSVIP